MKITYRLIGAAAFALAGLAAAPARADVVQAEYLFPDLGTVFENDGTQNTPFSFSLLGGELTLAGNSTSSVITLTTNLNSFFTPGAFNGPELIDLSSSPILNALYDSSSTIVGFNQSDISFNSNHLWLNMQGLTFTIGQKAVVDLTLSSGQTTVPEPMTLSLFGAGLVAAVAMRRGKKKTA